MLEGPIATGAAPTKVTVRTLSKFLPTILAETGEAAVYPPTNLMFCIAMELLVAGPGSPRIVSPAVPSITGGGGALIVSKGGLVKSSTVSLPPGLITVTVLQGV